MFFELDESVGALFEESGMGLGRGRLGFGEI
jgi:hypothetical protein